MYRFLPAYEFLMWRLVRFTKGGEQKKCKTPMQDGKKYNYFATNIPDTTWFLYNERLCARRNRQIFSELHQQTFIFHQVYNLQPHSHCCPVPTNFQFLDLLQRAGHSRSQRFQRSQVVLLDLVPLHRNVDYGRNTYLYGPLNLLTVIHR